MYADCLCVCHMPVNVLYTPIRPNQQLKNSKIKDVDVSTLNFYSSVLAVGSFFLRLEFSQTRRWAVLAVLMSIHTHHL